MRTPPQAAVARRRTTRSVSRRQISPCAATTLEAWCRSSLRASAWPSRDPACRLVLDQLAADLHEVTGLMVMGADASIVVNIKPVDPALTCLETPRLCWCLSNGVFVISEVDGDEVARAPFERWRF
jgi:hypothetical protein